MCLSHVTLKNVNLLLNIHGQNATDLHEIVLIPTSLTTKIWVFPSKSTLRLLKFQNVDPSPSGKLTRN